MEKKNTGLIVLVIVLCLSVGGLGGYIIGNKTFADGKDMNNDRSDVIENNKNNNYDNNDTIVNYSYGDEVTISKMSKVKDFIVGEGTIDLSKWYVLSDKDNVVTLYSDAIWGKGYKIDDKKDLFKEYGVTIENMRGLNEEELELLGCNVTTLTCNNVPTWAKNSVTSVVSEKSVILFSGDKLETMPNDGTALALIRPVITITKSILEAAK